MIIITILNINININININMTIISELPALAMRVEESPQTRVYGVDLGIHLRLLSHPSLKYRLQSLLAMVLLFSCPDEILRQLYTYPCHSLTHSLTD